MLSHRHAGMSLIELLISMAIGLGVITAAVSFYTNSLRLGGGNLRMGHLSGELRAAMLYMTREIRRAGYSGVEPGSDLNDDGTVDGADLALLQHNPFSDLHDLSTGRYDADEPADSCLLFSYNLDAESEAAASPPLPYIGICEGCTPPAPYHLPPYDTGNMELQGFRLHDGALERRNGGVGGLDCRGVGDQWQDVTSSEIEIDTLRFAIDDQALNVRDPALPCATGLPCLHQRRVTVTLAGALAGDPATRVTLQETLSIRNAKYVPSAP